MNKYRTLLGAAMFLAIVAFHSESLWSAGATKFASREEEIADAIKKNDVIFEGWPKPQFTLIFTGEMDGYIEPCGCAGLENQLGGMKRRYTFIKELRDNGWNPVPLDMGGQVRRPGPQSQIKCKFAFQSLIDCGYQAVAFGFHDLEFTSDTVVYVAANLDEKKNPLVSANVDLYGIAKPFKVIEIAGKKIGVTAVLGAKHRQAFAESDEMKILDPVEGLKVVVPQIEAAKCDLSVLLVHGDPEEAAELARQFPQFDFVGTTGGAETPPNRSRPIEGTNSYLVEAGHKGQYAIAIGVYDDPQQPLRYQRVPLDHRFADAKEMQDLMIAYQKELEVTGLEGLGARGTKHPVDSYAGSEACADCHTQAYAIWEETPHAHATDTLVNLNPPRHFDPECLSCHVTGWNPQEFFPYISGYMGLEETPLMHNGGCENCHGPAAAHVAAEEGDEILKDSEIEELRKALRIKLVENEGNKEGQVLGTVVKKCQECHDLDNSPDFDFQEYWPKVKHEGMD